MLKSAKRAIGQVKISKAFIILWSMFLAGFAVSFFYFKWKAKQLATDNMPSHANGSAISSGKDTLIIPAPVQQPIQKTTSASKEKLPEKKKPAKPIINPRLIEAPHEKNIAVIKKEPSAVASKGHYKIISKAYFHNEPDESTRRNAFVNHWNNSYATLNALDEKNGFIYVVFRNHLNQTSKGWLRKKDLRPVQE